jgi:hypothetical protein
VDEFFDHTAMIDLQYEVITGMSGFSQAQIMLSLALLSYRGFWNPGSDNRQGMAGAITEGLDQLEPLKGDWVLVWGPGTYRYLGSVFDSSMMYVVQHKKEAGRYAIVVRGTNPVALFDWVLGDFLSHRQVPWHHCSSGVAPQASLSLSTALGLKILLNMRAGPGTGDIVEAGKFSSLLDLGMRVLSTAKGAGDAGLATAGEAVNSTAADVVQEGATRLIEGLQKYQGQWSFADKIADAVISAIGNLLPLDDVADRVSFRQQVWCVGARPGAIFVGYPEQRGNIRSRPLPVESPRKSHHSVLFIRRAYAGQHCLCRLLQRSIGQALLSLRQ